MLPLLLEALEVLDFANESPSQLADTADQSLDTIMLPYQKSAS